MLLLRKGCAALEETTSSCRCAVPTRNLCHTRTVNPSQKLHEHCQTALILETLLLFEHSAVTPSAHDSLLRHARELVRATIDRQASAARLSEDAKSSLAWGLQRLLFRARSNHAVLR